MRILEGNLKDSPEVDADSKSHIKLIGPDCSIDKVKEVLSERPPVVHEVPVPHLPVIHIEVFEQ